jgi:hypothetical protein
MNSFMFRAKECQACHIHPNDMLKSSEENAASHIKTKSGPSENMSLNDLEFAYAPVRDQVRDLREYL